METTFLNNFRISNIILKPFRNHKKKPHMNISCNSSYIKINKIKIPQKNMLA